MENSLLYLTVAVFSFGTYIISANEVSAVYLSISQKERTHFAPVDASINKLHFHGSELKAAPPDDCKCENGKCMRVCDMEQKTPCVDERKVCVCNPEFAEKEKGECEYCDCGHGFNCTFERTFYGGWSKNCICPEGYTQTFTYSSKCRHKCSDEKPCQNGGECDIFHRCNCPYGEIRGDLCEEIIACDSKCENRLEVDCLYNQHERIAYCSCKNSSLYYDQEAGICKPCPCENGYCDYEYTNERKLVCRCHSGYAEFNGYCKKCECGFGVKDLCRFDSYGEKICDCLDGFYKREGHCRTCECMSWNDWDTKCEVTGNVKRCFCKEGFQDVLGHCEDINECETNNTCHPSATCYNKFGSFGCECPEGYEGRIGRTVDPGEACEDIDECKELSNACWYSNNVKCVNLPGSYKCECHEGYEPRIFSYEPDRTTCDRTTKNAGPAVIVVFTTLALIGLSCWMHRHVKRRAARSN